MINENSLNKYKKILSITQEKIKIIKNPYISRQAELGFDTSSKSWIIYYNIIQSEFPFIHELNHIYFAMKKCGYIYFALPPPPNPKLDRILGGLISNLLDCFVNYNLSEFEEIYPIIRQNDFIYLDNLGDIQNRIKSIDNLYTLLEWYILFYLDFRFILKEEDRKKRNQEIESFLNILQSKISNFKQFNQNNLKELTKYLDRFNKKKNENRPIRIISYFTKVLLKINIWTEEELKKQMNLFFPNFENF